MDNTTEPKPAITQLPVYISGKISGLPHSVALKNFTNAEKSLRNAGFIKVINPMTINRGQLSWAQYMIEDLKILMTCSSIAILPDYHTSVGAKIELEFARKIGLHVIMLSSKIETDVKQVLLVT